ncbi:MAG: alpha/beta hydrolase [Thermodesulfobacteriota bacterium]
MSHKHRLLYVPILLGGLAAGLGLLPGCESFNDSVGSLLAGLGLGPAAKVEQVEVCGPGQKEVLDPLTLPEHSPGVRVARDLVYARLPGVKVSLNSLDLYLPESGYCHPVVVFIHGGGWLGGDKRHVDQKPEAFVRRGYILASVNYRLSPAVRHPEHVKDVARALKFIRDNAARYRGDPTEIFLLGHSAGAHLAALVATDERYLEAVGLSLRVIRGVVLLDGAGYDLPLQMTMTGGPLFDQIYHMAFGGDPQRWRDASPSAHVVAHKGIPPFLLFHLGPRQATGVQAGKFAEVLTKAEVPVEDQFAQGVSHAALNSRLGQAGDMPTQKTFQFLTALRY